jgi:hypothetical protein
MVPAARLIEGADAGVPLPPAVAAYVADAAPPCRELQRALTQLAAFLLKRLTGRRATVDLGPVEAARAALREGNAALAAIRVPAAAAHHHRHLAGARDALEAALGHALRRGGLDEDGFFGALEEAERHLKAAQRIVPGFEPVDLAQACCAAHGLLRYRAAEASP